MARKRSIHPATERALLTWAAQKRLVLAGEEGFSPINVIGKLRERERDAGGDGKKSTQRWPEVYWGDGLAVQKIAVSMAEMPRMVLSAYYVLQGSCYTSAGEQARYIGIEVRRYWTELEIAENVIESGIKLLQAGGKMSEREPA